MNKINKKKYTYLKILGIKTCLKCGHEMSLKNKICFNCDFSADDDDLHELMLNNKYSTFRKILTK